MKKGLFAVLAMAIALVLAPVLAPHAIAQTLPEPPVGPQAWPLVYTFTGATPAPMVVNVQGYNWCTATAETGAVFSSTTLTASDSNDSGTTYEVIHGSADLGATPAPADTLTAVGKLTFPVRAHNLFELVASGGGSSTNVVVAATCSI